MDKPSRRQHPRVHGPFDGWRVDLLDVPVRIYDLSLGGCFVNAILSRGIRRRLEPLGFTLLEARQAPANDGGIALGQAWAAIQRIS